MARQRQLTILLRAASRRAARRQCALGRFGWRRRRRRPAPSCSAQHRPPAARRPDNRQINRGRKWESVARLFLHRRAIGVLSARFASSREARVARPAA